MGFWDDLTQPVIPLLCKNPKLAGHAICGPTSSSAKKNLELLVGELEEWENSLEYAKYVQDFSEYAHKIEELRGKISVVRETLSKPLAYAATYEDSKELLSAIRRIRQIDPRTNPAAAAKAYGAAMRSFGRLVELLPPPANAVGTLIAEMGMIFHKVVANMQPEVHFREPGLREVIENL